METELLFVLCMTKWGCKISKGNAAMYSLYKSPFGIASFKKTDVRYHYTCTFVLIDNVIVMNKSHNYAILMKYLHAWASETLVCLIIHRDILCNEPLTNV